MDYIYILKFIGVMSSMALADICWTYYFITIEERHSFKAALWSSLIIIFGIFTTVNYVDDRTLIVAAIIGAFLGTYAAVEIKKRKETKAKQLNS